MLHKNTQVDRPVKTRSKRKKVTGILVMVFGALLVFTGVLQLRTAHADSPTVTINKNIQYQWSGWADLLLCRLKER